MSGYVGLKVGVRFDTKQAMEDLRTQLSKLENGVSIKIDTQALKEASKYLAEIGNVKLTLDGQAETLKYFTDVSAELEKQLKMAIEIRENYERTGTNGKMSRSEYNSQQKGYLDHAVKLMKTIVDEEDRLHQLKGKELKQAKSILDNRYKQLDTYKELITHEGHSETLKQKVLEMEDNITSNIVKRNQIEREAKETADAKAKAEQEAAEAKEKATKEAQKQKNKEELEAKRTKAKLLKEQEILKKIQDTYKRILGIKVALHGVDGNTPQAETLKGDLVNLQQQMGGYKRHKQWAPIIKNQDKWLEEQYALKTIPLEQKKQAEKDKQEQKAYEDGIKKINEHLKEKNKLLLQLHKIDKDDVENRKILEDEIKHLNQSVGSYKSKTQYKQLVIDLEKQYQRELDKTLAIEDSNNKKAEKQRTKKDKEADLNRRYSSLTSDETRVSKELIKALGRTKELKADINQLDESFLESLIKEDNEVASIARHLLKIKDELFEIQSQREELNIKGDPNKEDFKQEKAQSDLNALMDLTLAKQAKAIENDNISAAKQKEINQSRIQALETSILTLENGKNQAFIDHERLNNLKEQLKAIEQIKDPKAAAHSLRMISADLKDITSKARIDGMRSMGAATNQLSLSFGKLAQYFSGYTLINRFFHGFKEGLEVVRELDGTLTTLRITLTNFSEKEIAQLMKSTKALAVEMKSSFTDTMNVIKTVANETESLETIMAKARPALMLANLTGLDTASTTEMIQGVTRQYKSQFEELGLTAEEQGMKVADVMVAISRSLGMNFSTGVKGMAESVEIMGALSNELGMSIEETMALVAATAEQTRLSFSEISNAFKTTMARTIRISGTEEEVSVDDLAKTEKALNSVGVQVRNVVTGELRSFIDIMDDLSKKWEDLTDSQRGAIGDSMGGARQISTDDKTL